MFKKLRNKEITLVAPVSGVIKRIEDVNDIVFSSGMMGTGIAIDYEGGNVYAPANCEVMAIVESHHAIGLKLENGLELIIHVGLDTVNIQKKAFDMIVEMGDKVKKGEMLIKINDEELLNSTFDLITPIIFTNAQDYEIEEQRHQEEQVSAIDSKIFICKRK